eukprot:GFUD01023513.1.p1 GENE.GFUD01023513.1~~GFUD01023513.1.p1  ORF type:complete len:297 (+),score=83.59 GFUD01023513.1:238-1128(+)
MDPTVSWSRVRALPFFNMNMSHIRQMMEGRPVYGYGNRDFVNRNYDNTEDEYDFDRSENREDESNIRIPSFNELLRSQTSNIQTQSNPQDAETESYSGLSGDSLAFTLVYVSVFSVTLLYVGLKLARRWRARQTRIPAEAPDTPSLLPPCGHPQCARAAQQNASQSTPRPSYLPYTGLGGAWIPEIMTLQGLPQPEPRLHNTAVCRGRCGHCRTMALPPPSYTKLFLDEQPPAYTDDVVIKESDTDDLAEREESNSCTIDIECVEESDDMEDASVHSDNARTSVGEESPLNNDSIA